MKILSQIECAFATAPKGPCVEEGPSQGVTECPWALPLVLSKAERQHQCHFHFPQVLRPRGPDKQAHSSPRGTGVLGCAPGLLGPGHLLPALGLPSQCYTLPGILRVDLDEAHEGGKCESSGCEGAAFRPLPGFMDFGGSIK